MRKLFDQFEQLSTEAQALLEKGISQMRDGFAPAPSLCQKITSTLSSLRTAYDDIRRTLPDHVLTEELPEGELPVCEYEEVWKNSVVSRKKAVRAVLDEFIRVYSDEKKYMDAIEVYIRDAKDILACMNSAEMHAPSPDVSAFQLFLAGVKADLSSDEELYDQLLDSSAFSPRIVKGLHEKKYYIREVNVDKAPVSDTPCNESVAEAEPVSASEISEFPDTTAAAQEPQVESPASETPEDIEIETLTPEEFAARYASDAQESEESALSEMSEASDETAEDEEYIHPINPIKQTKLPSEQKLREMISRTGDVFHFLLNKLVFTGLMDEKCAFEALAQLPRPVTREQCIESFAFLERKGLLCTYEYAGRNILCFTELMGNCLQKSGLSSTLKRIYHLKSIGQIYFTGKQDMPLELFAHHMAMVDQYSKVIEMLDADEETAKKLETSAWNREKCYFLMNLTMDDGSLLPLHIVDSDDFGSSVPAENEGVFCCAGDLPGMDEVGDQLHYCLTANGLFHWSEGNWIAITHVEEENHDLPETVDSNVNAASESFSHPEVSQAEATDSETAAAPIEPIAPVKQLAIPAAEPVEGLWLDDLSEETGVEPEVTIDEFANLSSAEIAGRLLSAASNGNIPSDENMAVLIHQLLNEGVRSHDVRNCHDQLVEAVVFAKVLSSNDAFPLCRNIYLQLHAAIPFFREAGANTGVALSGIFADGTEFTPVTKLCAYIYGMLFPAHAHDHTFAALYNNAFTEYESQFPGLDVLKPLYHKAMEGVKLVPTAFSPANLAALGDSKIRQEHMNSIRSQAIELLKPPTVKVMIHGVPELIDLCFGSQTDLHTALQIVTDNDISMRELVKAELDKYCKDDDIDISTLERLLDSQWSVAAQKYSSRRMGIKYDARKHLLHAFEERLNLLRDWLDETNTESEPDIEKLRAIRSEVLYIIEDSLSEINIAPYSAAYGIMKASLELIRAKLQNQGSGVDFTTLLRSGMLVIDHGELILNDDLNAIEFAEPWRMMLQHIACTEYDLKIVYDRILEASPDSVLYDNFGQMEAIGRLIGADPKEYVLTNDGLRDAINSADLQARNFREKLEISYAYNRISENDRERLAMLANPEASDFQKFFYDHRAFGCWRGFLNALRAQIRETAQQSMHDVRAQLDQAKAMLRADEESPLIAEAERLISQEQNYAVAEDYIHRFRNGERDLPFETSNDAIEHFLRFISDDEFPRLYGFCERNKQDPMPRWAVQYMKKNTPEGWTTRHIEDARRFIEKWPVGKQSVNAQNIQEYFKLLGFHVECCAKSTRGNEVCCTLTVHKTEQNLADYRHPISIFGTQMKSQIEVVCLFGKRTATQLIDDACKLGITSTFIVLLDADLSTADRRAMAKYVFTQKNVGQASFLVIDRVLALYLAMQSSNERLPAMLQCTLPYTIYQPFTNGSGSTADEMFFGRVSELASIRDMAGASIVYGGRQLGKTALLERAMHLDHNPARREFAIKADFKGHRGEQDFLDILVSACNDVFEKNGFKLNRCATIRDFCSQIRCLLDNDRIAILRLLLDETDDFLDSISDSSYNEILPLIELQRGSNRRFKFVLAGLHNVCRAKNATRNNGLFGQLGEPLCVKPLTAADAQRLLVRPLRYLGFRVSNESHVDTILTNTNYYPGIIQFFGYTLVQTLVTHYTQYYDAVRGNPPFDLHDDQLASIMNSRDLNRNIKDRLRWTLEMDDRYYMLARCITVLYHLYSNNYSVISSGFDVASICEVKDMYNIHCLESLSEREIVALLDEMEEMGILSRPTAEENRYLLRRRSFIDVIGTSLEILDHDIKTYNEEAANNA